MKQKCCLNQAINTVKYGVWIDGHFSWVDSENWICIDKNEEKHRQIFKNKTEKLSIIFESNVDVRTILQNITLVNLSKEKRTVKLFISQQISYEMNDAVTFFAPSAEAIVRSYKGQYLLLNGLLNKRGIIQYCTDYNFNDSLNDGQLKIHPFSYGTSIPVFSLEGTIEANDEVNAYFWLCTGCNENEIINDNLLLQLNLQNWIYSNDIEKTVQSCSN